MFGTTSPNPAASSQQQLCYYCNHTSKVQVGLIPNSQGQHLEQILFPGQRWMFWANPDAILEIYDSEDLANAQIQRFTCQDLRVLEVDGPET